MKNPCNRCQRKGLAIFLALYAAVPKEAAKGLPLLSGNFGKDVTDKPLTESSYVLRGLEPGYVYLLYPNKIWKGYLIDAAGYPRYYADLALEDMPNKIPAESDVVTCAQQGKNHSGVEAICIEFPELIKGTVYIAYSRHKWTRKVRTEIAQNPLQSGMQQLASLDGAPFVHAEVASAENLRKWLIDFNADMVRQVNKDLPEGVQVQDRSAKAEDVAQTMLRFSGELKKPGIIVALHDHVGITARLAALRNMRAFERTQIEKKYEQDMFIKQAADRFMRQCEKLAKTDPRAAEKAKLYAKAYDSVALGKALQARGQELPPIEKRLAASSVDWQLWAKNKRLGAWFGKTYDPRELASGLDCMSGAAECLSGAGATQSERDLISSWLQGDVADPGNLIWTALAGNQKGLLEALMGQKGSMVNGFKGAWSAADEFERALPKSQQALLARLRHGSGLAGTAASADSAVAAVSKLFYVLATNLHAGLELTGTLALRATVLAAVWSGVRYGAREIKTGLREAVRSARQAVWGGTAASQMKVLHSNPSSRLAQFNLAAVADQLQLPPERGMLRLTGLVPLEVKKTGSGLWVPIEYAEPRALGAAVIVRPPAPAGMATNSQGRVWLPEELTKTITPATHWQRSLRLLREGGANGTLASGVLVFQMIGFFDAMKALEGTTGEAELQENGLLLYSGMLGMMGAGLEIVGAAIQLHSAVKGAQLVQGTANFVRGATVVGGLVGAGAGVVMAAAVYSKAVRLEAYGDDDAALANYWLAGATVAGSVTAGLGALAASSAAASATGAASIVGTSGIMLGMGPFGWAALTVGLIGVGIYLAIRADDATDDPVERWLKRSKYGIAKEKFRDATEENEEFGKLYELPLKIELRTLSAGGSNRHQIEVRLTAPALDKDSALAYHIAVVQGHRQQHSISDTLMLLGGKSTPSLSADLVQQGELLRVEDLTRVGGGVGVVRWWVNGRRVQRGQIDPRTGQIAHSTRGELTALGVKVHYYPQPKKDPKWILSFEQQMQVVP